MSESHIPTRAPGYTELSTDFRTDVEEMFKMWLPQRSVEGKSKHFPFLVVETNETGFHLKTVTSVQALLAYPDNTLCFVQWPGHWRSDFFEFTVGQYRTFRDGR